MRTIAIGLFFAAAVSIANAAGVDPAAQKGVTEAMQRNFSACNEENIRATMDSCSMEMPERDRFEREAKDVFQEKDIYYSIVECEVLEVKPPYALARIVQDTHVENRDSGTRNQSDFRNNSALLPDERVEYLNTFKFENGVWKLLVIVSEMKPVKAQPAN